MEVGLGSVLQHGPAAHAVVCRNGCTGSYKVDGVEACMDA